MIRKTLHKGFAREVFVPSARPDLGRECDVVYRWMVEDLRLCDVCGMIDSVSDGLVLPPHIMRFDPRIRI